MAENYRRKGQPRGSGVVLATRKNAEYVQVQDEDGANWEMPAARFDLLYEPVVKA